MTDANVSDADFLPILHLLEERTGLKFRSDQYENTINTIRKVTKQWQIEGSRDIKQAITSRSDVLTELINALTVGETYFFREPRHFDFITETILPDIRARRGLAHRMRAWSAGCASGEEAYSLAIAFHKRGLSDQIRILATDLSEAALKKARKAVFRPWSFRGDSMNIVEPYVTKLNDEYQLRDVIRKRVEFRPLNLATDSYPSVTSGICDMDLIMCRNVLIYFGRETIEGITQRFFKSLTAGGWLITASGDPPLAEFADFEVVNHRHGVFYRRPLPSDTKPLSHSGSLATGRLPSRSFAPGAGRTSVPSMQRSAEPSESPSHAPARGSKRPIESDEAIAIAAGPQTIDQTSAPPAQGRQGKTAAPGLDTPAEVVGKSSSDVKAAIKDAAAALQSGDHPRAAQLTKGFPDEPTACVIHVKAVAASDPEVATEICRTATERHPLCEELHYLLGVLLADANRSLEALQSVQKVLFLNRSSVMAHFLFGSIQFQQGQLKSARRHFRNVCELSALLQPSTILPLSNGETVMDIATAAESQLTRLDAIIDS